jgi:uncharacterized protein YfaP (DUF2135 family)
MVQMVALEPVARFDVRGSRRALRESGCNRTVKQRNYHQLSWNTDITDIDLHVFDPNGNHAPGMGEEIPSAL